MKKFSVDFLDCIISILKNDLFRQKISYHRKNGLTELLKTELLIHFKHVSEVILEFDTPSHCFTQEFKSLFEKLFAKKLVFNNGIIL